jgi:glycosyltransferase involved in cell wall biosynthesis
MDRRDKRVLWLINHKTMIEFEPDLFESLGFEVYIPKLFPPTLEFRSLTITYDYDSKLTIPQDALELLNNFDFYSTKITPGIRNIMNTFFSVVIVNTPPFIFSQIIRNFNGIIILRAVGRFGLEKDLSYGHMYESILGSSFPDAIKSLGPRFYFGIIARGFEIIEPDYFRQRSLYLPTGLPERFFSSVDSWNGNDPRLLLYCPLINESDYFTQVYDQFKRDFKGIPHLISGQQVEGKIEDPVVIGKVNRNEFDLLLSSLRVLYYYSQEPFHHYDHPLEAIALGMPVIYMKSGNFGNIHTGTDQPGECRTIAEARKKIKRLLSGDIEFTAEIRSKQKNLLRPYTKDYCLSKWRENFIPIITEVHSFVKPKTKKIAVMLPAGYTSGTFDAAKSIAKMIYYGSRVAGNPVDVVFSFLAGHYDSNNDFIDLKKLGLELRETSWEVATKQSVENIMKIEGHLATLNSPEYLIPRDYSSDFLDTECWIIVSDTLICPPAPIRRYGVVIHDCLARYFKEYQAPIAVDGRTATARGADFILSTTPQTREDIISFHGIHPDRVILAPFEFSMDIDQMPSNDQKISENYFIWPTNDAIHKNHINAIDGLIRYYNEGGKLDVIMTGFGVEKFEINEQLEENQLLPHIVASRRKIKNNKMLKERLRIYPNLSKYEYHSLIKKSRFLWHPALTDNGTFTVVEAAMLGVPGLSSDYPQMRYLDKYFGLNLTFFNQTSPESIAKALTRMEGEYLSKKAQLPDPEKLSQLNWENNAENYYNLIKDLI